jgi:hypothetical protein
VKKSGKDLSAQFINSIGYRYRRIGLADKLKDVCSAVFSIERWRLDSQACKETLLETPRILTREQIQTIMSAYGVGALPVNQAHVGKVLRSIREILQYVGTDVLRSLEESIHFDNIQMDEDKDYIITDVRFADELYWVHRLGGIVFFVHRPEAELTVDSHPSEKQVLKLRDRCDLVIHNTGSREDLLREVQGVMGKYESLYIPD